MFLQYEIIPIIVVGFATIVVGDVATIVVYQTATIVIGIVTIVVLIVKIVVTSSLHMDCGLKTLSTATAVELLGNFSNLLLFVTMMQYNNLLQYFI